MANKTTLVEIKGFGSLKPFKLSATEVTQKEYFEVTGKNPSKDLGDNKPVHNVTVYDAIDYCNVLSKKEGLRPYYIINGNTITADHNSYGYRLPTEEEWIWAAKDLMHCLDLDKYAWYKGTSKSVMDVAQKESSNGLYDLLGNVSEWCWDNGNVFDFGGNYKNTRSVLLEFKNNGHCGNLKYNRVGFRVAKSIPESVEKKRVTIVKITKDVNQEV